MSHREEGLRWTCPAGFERTLAADAEGLVTVAFKVSGAIRTEADGARERLSRGLWDAHLELSGFGLARDLRLGADREAGIDLNRPTASHCQSGGRASVMAFGLELMGAQDVRNYYRGWSEWGNVEDTPVEPGKKSDE